MTTAIVFYTPTNEDPPRRGPRYFDKVYLEKGRNTLNQNQLEMLKNHPDYPQYADNKIIDILDDSIMDNVEETLKGLSVSTAIELIKREKDPKKLQRWLDSELASKKRTQIVNSINLQLDDIKRGRLIA